MLHPVHTGFSTIKVNRQGLDRRFLVGDRIFLTRQVIMWGMGRSESIMVQQEGKRLYLTGYDYAGNNIAAKSEPVSISFVNSNDVTLVLPENFLCAVAKEEMTRLSGRLFLKIEEPKQNGALRTKLAELHIGKESPTRKEYGLLILGSGL